MPRHAPTTHLQRVEVGMGGESGRGCVWGGRAGAAGGVEHGGEGRGAYMKMKKMCGRKMTKPAVKGTRSAT